MGYIYKITNNINGKGYVGQTIQPIENRWAQHIATSSQNKENKKYAIHYAIEKYGLENFSFSILEEVSDDSLLNDKEIYWIEKEKTYVEEKDGHGYNLTRGGEGVVKFDGNQILQLWNEGYNIKEISNQIGCSLPTCSFHLHRKGISTRDIYDRRDEFNSNLHGQPVFQFDLNGNFIKQWKSLGEIHKILGYEQSLLSLCINQKVRYAYNFLWTKTQEDLPKALEFYNNPRYKKYRPVGQYTLENELIKIWESAEQAGRELKVDPSAIRKVCNNVPRYKTSKGFKWQYMD